MEPITPDAVASQKTANIPDFVIGVFNEMITEAWSGRNAVLMQNAVVKRVIAAAKKSGISKTKRVTSQRVFEEHWLDVEPIFRRVGWVVNYDKPGYCETYEASWAFSKG